MRFLAVLLAACTSPAQPQKRVERRSPTHVQPLQRKEVEPEAKPRVILHTELREPFWQVVRASLQSYIVTTSETKVRACVYFNADGTVGGTRVRRSGDDELDAAAERALAGLEQARERLPVPPPRSLREEATRAWNCFDLGMVTPP